MKRSPQVSVKSSSISRELQSINTAGRASSQEGRGATGCCSCNSQGTQMKRHNLYYYSLQKRKLCLCWQTTAVKQPQLYCHLPSYKTATSAGISHKDLVLCPWSSCSLPRAEEDMAPPIAPLTFFRPFPSWERNHIFSGTKHNYSSLQSCISSSHTPSLQLQLSTRLICSLVFHMNSRESWLSLQSLWHCQISCSHHFRDHWHPTTSFPQDFCKALFAIGTGKWFISLGPWNTVCSTWRIGDETCSVLWSVR